MISSIAARTRQHVRSAKTIKAKCNFSLKVLLFYALEPPISQTSLFFIMINDD